MKKILDKYWHILIFTLFALTPILWFWNKPGILVNGVDTNFPLNPYSWIYRRFFVWDAVLNAGANFSSSIAGTFFHSIQVLPRLLGFSLQGVELFSFVFWFFGIVFSSWIFARLILPKSRISQILLVGFYSFNTYLFNTWENVKVANLSLAVTLPLCLSVLYLLKEKRISLKKGFFFSLVIGILGSGAGINPSYVISLFLASLLFSVGLIFDQPKVSNLLPRLRDFTVLLLGIILANLFWIIPTAYYIYSNVPAFQSLKGIGFNNWVDGLSENTSLFNILRLQGAWDWYATDGAGVPYYIPYALKFFKNTWFLGFSVLIPALSFASYLFKDKTKNGLYLAFCLMIIIGVFLGAGTHSPTGAIFRFLGNHMPFFGIFRSPWYIFTSFLTLAYASLIGLLFSVTETKYKFLTRAAFVLLLVGNLLYNYPLILGRIFRPGRSDTFYTKFPQYVLDALNWVNTNNTGRILGYPDDEIEQFNWGYRGIESILQLGTNKEVLYKPLNLTNTPIVETISELYLAIKKNQLDIAASIFPKLGIRTLFYKSDQRSISLGLPIGFTSLPSKQFGEWFFYDLSNLNTLEKIYLTNDFYYVYPFAKAVKSFSQIPNSSVFLNPGDSVAKSLPEISKEAGLIVVSQNSQVDSYLDFNKTPNNPRKTVEAVDTSKVQFTFEIPKNGLFKPSLERYKLEDFGINPSKALEVTLNGTIVRLNPVKISDYVEYQPISMEAGKYVLKLNLNNKNVVSDGDFENTTSVLKTSFGAQAKTEQVNGNRFLTITNSTNERSSVGLDIASFDPLSKYLISFDYLWQYGNPPQIALIQESESTQFKIESKEGSNFPDWKTYNSYFEPVVVESGLRLDLIAKESSLGGSTKVEYDNVKLIKLFTNELMFVSESKPVLFNSKYSYQKINPVKYTGKITNGTGEDTIVFLENYTEGWKISFKNKDGRTFKPKLAHFSTNLYANAWYIEGAPSEYDFTIYYWPQKLLYLGFGATLLSFAVGFLLAFPVNFNKKKND